MEFSGFPRAGLELLACLPDRDKEWFKANRTDYDAHVMEPARGFVEEMTEELRSRISSGITGVPKVNGSISPINRDMRFSEDKTPYKDHLLFRWWEGPVKKAAPTLLVRLSADSVGFGSGATLPSADSWRSWIADDADGGELVRAIESVRTGRDAEVAGEELKRVPAPYPSDHPRSGLLRHKAWFQVRWPERLPEVAGTPGFVSWCAGRLTECAGIHHWLVAHLNS